MRIRIAYIAGFLIIGYDSNVFIIDRAFVYTFTNDFNYLTVWPFFVYYCSCIQIKVKNHICYVSNLFAALKRFKTCLVHFQVNKSYTTYTKYMLAAAFLQSCSLTHMISN